MSRSLVLRENLIRRISSDHPEWGEDRIALELRVKLGVKRRIREATPFGSGPRFLVHDNDGVFGQFGRRRPGRTGRSYRSALDLWLGEVLCIEGIPIPYGAPNAAAHIERFMGSLKRECLDHFIFLSEDHLRRTITTYITYPNEGRPHQGIEGIPECGPVLPRATRPATEEDPGHRHL